MWLLQQSVFVEAGLTAAGLMLMMLGVVCGATPPTPTPLGICCVPDCLVCLPVSMWLCILAGELEFLPNPYLVAADGAADGRPVLVKSYTFQTGVGTDRLLHSKVVAAPKWSSSSQDPTHKVGKDGKQRPASSIFQLFKQSGGGGKYAFNLTGSGKDVQVRAWGDYACICVCCNRALGMAWDL